MSRYTCPVNPDVERFAHEQSVEFTKQNLSVAYLVTDIIDNELLAYFALAIKPISVNTAQFSNTMRRKIEKIAQVNEQTGEYLVAAFLIAQLGKNFTDGMNDRITGVQLLELAVDKVRALQYMAGGTVVFLETQNVPQLLSFYEANASLRIVYSSTLYVNSVSCAIAQRRFKQFAVRQSYTPDQHKLVQLLRVL